MVQKRSVRRASQGAFGAFVYDPDADRYSFDEGAQALLGRIAGAEATYSDMLRRMPPASRRAYEAWRHDTIATGTPGSMRVPFTVDGGREVTLEVHLHRTEGVVRGLVVDVTEDETRREGEERNLTLMTLAERVARFGSWRYDIKNDQFWGSPGAGLMWTFGDANAAPGTAMSVALAALHPDDRAAVEGMVNHALTTGQSTRVEFRPAANPDMWLATMAIRVLDDAGDPDALYGIVMDVTAEHDRHDLQERAVGMEKREAMRTRFVNAAAHELSQPLTPLRLRLAALKRRGSPDPELLKSYALMERNLDRIQLMLQDLLDAAQIQSNRLKLHTGDVDVNETVTWTIDTLAPLAHERQVTISWRPREREAMVLDATRLQQCVSNLVHNAIKFSPAGGTVRVDVESSTEELRVSVSDDGPGLDADQVGRVFEAFEQVHSSPGATGGTGLGLYITDAIAKAFGGRVVVESAPGQGATFTLVLPVKSVTGQVKAPTA